MKKLLLLSLLGLTLTPVAHAKNIDKIEEELVSIELDLNDTIDELYKESNGFILKGLNKDEEPIYENEDSKFEFLYKGRYYMANVNNAWVFEYTNLTEEEVNPFEAMKDIFTVEISNAEDATEKDDWTIYPLYMDSDDMAYISQEFSWDKPMKAGASQLFMIIYPKDYLYDYSLLLDDGEFFIDAYVSEYE